MSLPATLGELLERAIRQYPDRRALTEPGAGAGGGAEGQTITYAELATLARAVHARLVETGVRPGDRVGVVLPKSIDAVAIVAGILRAGAAYVPVDSTAPTDRNRFILEDCAVRAVFLERPIPDLGGTAGPEQVVIDPVGGGHGFQTWLGETAADELAPAHVAPADLAYILYTSGSTGQPKGVALSHANGMGFVNWCVETLAPSPEDTFSSHAPFHFDLSILDLYVALGSGARLVLIGEALGKEPGRLAAVIAEEGITTWYSTPSILSLLAEFGKLESHHYPALRTVLFAGEVFPIKHFRALARHWPHPRYFNLYGPTETNVCTSFEVRLPIPDDRTEPFPIGAVCPHLAARVVDEADRDVPTGTIGELCIDGANVMEGYWGRPTESAAAFLQANPAAWYRTGDLVIADPDGVFTYCGRRDRMVKRRGYRVELGEIESGLYRHPSIREAAVVAETDPDRGVLITAFVGCDADQRPSIIALKRFCSEQLPRYMIPDFFMIRDTLPKTSTDKTDYQALRQMTGPVGPQ